MFKIFIFPTEQVRNLIAETVLRVFVSYVWDELVSHLSPVPTTDSCDLVPEFSLAQHIATQGVAERPFKFVAQRDCVGVGQRQQIRRHVVETAFAGALFESGGTADAKNGVPAKSCSRV